MAKQMVKAPKGEVVWCRYHDLAGQARFLITSKETSRDFYFLYAVDGSKLQKLGKSRSPMDLEVRYKLLVRSREDSA